MSLWKIAWRSIQQRGLASTLTALSMALGVMMVVAVLLIHGVVTQSFRNNSTLGYNMIVGAKGGKLQLVLNTVYYLSQPVENVPYDFYLSFLTAEEVKQLHSAEELDQLIETRRANLNRREARQLADMSADQQREWLLTGRYAIGITGETNLAIPVCLGDYYKQYRVIGTTPKLFNDLVYDPDRNKTFEFAEGRNFKRWDKEHGYFEAVVGSTVAHEYDLSVGDKITASHGAAEGEGEAHDENPFIIVGILKASGTPNDRAVFVNMEGFYLMEGHAKPVIEEELPAADEDFNAATDTDAADNEEAADDTDAAAKPDRIAAARTARQKPLPLEEREVTSILLRTGDFDSMAIANEINEGQIAQAVMPIAVIYELLDQIVAPVQWLLLAITVMICLVSGVGILVSIYNSMSERKHEIAVIRALGAGRKTVMTIVLLESIMLALGGGLIGWVAGHVLIASGSGAIEQRTGVSIGLLDFAPAVKLSQFFGGNPAFNPGISTELLLVPGLILLAVIVGFMPALAAYRTDVAKSLQ